MKKTIGVICDGIEMFIEIRASIDPMKRERWVYVTEPSDLKGCNVSNMELIEVRHSHVPWELREEIMNRFSKVRVMDEEILLGYGKIKHKKWDKGVSPT